FGTVLIPEGLIEFIPSMKDLIAELNEVLVDKAAELEGKNEDEKMEIIKNTLSPVNADLYSSLPKDIALQLSLDRDSHGNVQVSLIETESLLSEMVGRRLEEMRANGQYSGKFAAQHHFFGYEGRCADPTNFDADYCYALGYNAAMLINSGLTGYMSSVRNLTDKTENWICGGIPITMMMNMERRHGEMKPVIQKALVDLKGRPYLTFASRRETLALNTLYQYPGPIQYFGPAEICDRPSMTLLLEHDKEID
ncbi:MAG: diphosphate--fructose-6-phosphate 1-phosphotransferase, partial [Muribaculaceae bacterium]|nr:diphosphate--fructose-6-phosphate 1-phosphotransferase [Muribaculaceae bacterium]